MIAIWYQFVFDFLSLRPLQTATDFIANNMTTSVTKESHPVHCCLKVIYGLYLEYIEYTSIITFPIFKNRLIVEILSVLSLFTSPLNPSHLDYLGTPPYSSSGDVLLTSSFISINTIAGLILGLQPGSEKRGYKETPYLIGWTQT